MPSIHKLTRAMIILGYYIRTQTPGKGKGSAINKRVLIYELRRRAKEAAQSVNHRYPEDVYQVGLPYLFKSLGGDESVDLMLRYAVQLGHLTELTIRTMIEDYVPLSQRHPEQFLDERVRYVIAKFTQQNNQTRESPWN